MTQHEADIEFAKMPERKAILLVLGIHLGVFVSLAILGEVTGWSEWGLVDSLILCVSVALIVSALRMRTYYKLKYKVEQQ